MKKTILILLVLFNVQLNLEAASLIPMKDFFKNPQRSYYTLSPDGKRFSFTAPYKKRMNIFIQDVQLKRPAHRMTNVTDRNIYEYIWKGNNHLLYLKDFGGDENDHIFCVDLKTKKTRDMTPFKGVKSYIVDGLEDIKNDEILIAMNKRNKELFDVYSLNINTGELVLKVENFANIKNWITDHKGNVRVAYANDGINATTYYRESQDKPFKKIFSTNFRNTFSPIMFTSDDKDIYVKSNINADKAGIVRYDPLNRKEVKVLFRHPDVDVDSLSYSKKRKVLLEATYYLSKEEHFFFDDETKHVFEAIQQKLPDDVKFYLTSNDKDEDLFTVRSYSDRTLGSYYIYDVKKDELKKITDRNPWIKVDNMAHMEPIEYLSRDGLTIHGYLTLPKDKEAKDLPVVIYPHGGPWLSKNYWGYDSSVQFFANRGYAVLQMNFRGSPGYGRKFYTASFKQWGQKMQNDISDGVKWLIDKGIADPKRIAIYGESYGGYAVLAGMAFTPELYACGVDSFGISNLFTFLNTLPPYWKPEIDAWYEKVGNPEKDKELLTKASPLFHADKIKAPLLIAQGVNDPRVNINESDQMVDALKKRGVKVTYMVKKDEGHGFSNEENRFDFYRLTEKFLAECIGNKK